MSTLTKILIVLLTIAAIFLSGIVVTYVANAVNYKGEYDTLNNRFHSEQQRRKSTELQLEEATNKANQQREELKNEIASLNSKIAALEEKLDAAERERDKQLNRADRFAALVEGLTNTNDKQGLLLKNTIARLEDVEADLVKEQSQHKETSRELLAKLVILADLEEKNKRLLEEKAEVQTQLDQLLRQYGKVTAPPTAITPITAKAQPVPVPTKKIGLKGQIVNVDFKNKMAEISVGKAHGVEEGMRFHVTRGDQFICDIVILDVQPEKAAGWLELIQDEPKAGDSISTNL